MTREAPFASRPLQTAMDGGDEYPVGPLPQSVILGDNASLIASVAPIVDFRDLPHADRSWDAVCFDPPYVPRLGRKAPVRLDDARYRQRYGLDTPRGHREVVELIFAGLAECARVADRWVLAKCCDYVTSRRLYLGHVELVKEGERLGLRVHDLIVHAAGAGPGDRQIREVRRSRRAHSYLIVFAVPRVRRAS